MCREYLDLVVVAVLGLMTAGIGYLQWQTSRQQLKSQIYDRRMRTHEDTKKFLLDLHGTHPLKDDTLIRLFKGATSDVQFLFGKNSEVHQFISEIQERSERILWDDSAGNGRSKDHQLWILNQFDLLTQKFEPHLSIKV